MVTKTANQKYPSCIGEMYELGEKYMASNCMGCRAFNDCSGIGGGVETTKASVLIPEEPSTWGEIHSRW
ncbi:MAG TPA: hypothetical protein VMW50_03295 [Dehalococcoidia bacterium]|nr:hypothetical protein [Dehalococcoidia bacterium]